MRRGWFVIASSALLALSLAGPAVAAKKPLTHKQLLKAGDEICQQAIDLINEVTQEHFGDFAEDQEATDEEISAYAQDVHPISDQEIDSLRALPAAKADKKKLKKIFTAFEQGYNTLYADPAGVFNSGADPLAKVGPLAQNFGFDVCGS